METSTIILISVIALMAANQLQTIQAAEPDQQDVHNFVIRMSIPGAPTGLYSTWSEMDRKERPRTVSRVCLMMCVEGVSAFSTAKQEGLRREEAQTCGAACLASHLPPDHPLQEKMREEAIQHYEVSKKLGSQFPPPRFGE
jgi:hypothetical protein